LPRTSVSVDGRYFSVQSITSRNAGDGVSGFGAQPPVSGGRHVLREPAASPTFEFCTNTGARPAARAIGLALRGRHPVWMIRWDTINYRW